MLDAYNHHIINKRQTENDADQMDGALTLYNAWLCAFVCAKMDSGAKFNARLIRIRILANNNRFSNK